MVRRAYIALSAAALAPLAALPGCFSRGSGTPYGLVAGAPAPAGLTAVQSENRGEKKEGQVEVSWVFRAEDLMSCKTSARDLRHAQRRFGDGITVSAFAVDTDPELVASFLRNERLDLPVVNISERDYRQMFGSEATPAVVVTQGQQVIEVLAAGRQIPRGRRGTAALVERLKALVPQPTDSLPR